MPRCWFSFLLAGLGRHDEGFEQVSLAHQADPLSPYVNTCVGLSLTLNGAHARAIDALQQALDMEPDFPYTH